MNPQSPQSKQSPDDMLPLLLEIGVEEIPSDVLPKALSQLPQIAKKCFTATGISFSEPQVYGTPRRLILYFPELAVSQATREEIVVGPPKRAAFDVEGKPTRAAEGFAKSQNTPLSDIKIEDAATLGAAAKGKKGEYLVLRKIKTGESTVKCLETILPEIIASLRFPRSMRWNDTGIAFVRPIRSILALYGDIVVPFSFAGVSSGDRTQGHHIMAPEFFQVTDFENYQAELSHRFVMIDPKKRVDAIKAQVDTLAKEKDGTSFSLDNPGREMSLILDAAYSVENPKAICGDFDQSFLNIPKEIIITAMSEHQGYFPLFRGDGTLLSHFITILNIDAKDLNLIQKGNERVLRARLHDAQFYFDQDRKQRLSDRLSDLNQVMFQEKLGSVYEKVKRIQKLSAFIADKIGRTDKDKQDLERAAMLCKNDLVTGVVREFTSLQGTMGSVYAERDEENENVVRAIKEHYLPRHAGDKLPAPGIGQILAIADKLDTIVGCFGVGLIPTGSEDPYALRRQGLGIIQILVEYASFDNFSLEGGINEAIKLYAEEQVAADSGLCGKIVSFFKLRMDSHLQLVHKVRTDLRFAVLAKMKSNTFHSPRRIVQRAVALDHFSKQIVFRSLITVYKRVDRILPDYFKGEVDESVFVHASEKKLYVKYVAVREETLSLSAKQSYAEVLAQLATLNDPLNHFFDDVMVMDKDEVIQKNRLSLLLAVREPFKAFGDFSKIVDDQTTS